MPFFQRETIQLLLLLICVPLQFFLTANTGGTIGRSQAFFKIGNEIKYLHDTWFNLDTWRIWWLNMFYNSMKVIGIGHGKHLKSREESGDHRLESPAIEVFQYKERMGHFAASSVPRTSRPSHLRFRVGQVVKHKKLGVKGVIIGWDISPKAPDSWFKRMFEKNKIGLSSPHYLILIDEQDGGQKEYVIQEDLRLLKEMRIQHQELENYFDEFDGAQYIPKSPLKKIYPLD